MRAAGLVGCCRQRRPRTTVVDATRPPAPNLVARDFAAAEPKRLWVGDITYLPTREGWLYPAVLLDAHYHRVVGWAMAGHLRAALALAMALQARRAPPGLVHYTERGGQYTATAYQDALAARRLACSMRRAGECMDNAMAESFFSTRKAELIGARPWATRAAARSAVFEWLAYRPPAAFEEDALLLHDPAA
jgi:putative transposase